MARRPVGKRSIDDEGAVRVRGKAANGEGSVYFASDGRWRATYRVPGEGRPRTASGTTARRRSLPGTARLSSSPNQGASRPG